MKTDSFLFFPRKSPTYDMIFSHKTPSFDLFQPKASAYDFTFPKTSISDMIYPYKMRTPMSQKLVRGVYIYGKRNVTVPQYKYHRDEHERPRYYRLQSEKENLTFVERTSVTPVESEDESSGKKLDECITPILEEENVIETTTVPEKQEETIEEIKCDEPVIEAKELEPEVIENVNEEESTQEEEEILKVKTPLEISENVNDDLTFVEERDNAKRIIAYGYYRKGVRVGLWWFNNKDGSSLVGQVDSDGKLTGPDVAYIYPDRWTALVGHFEAGVMKSAKLARVQKINNNIPEFKFVASSVEYKYDKSTHDKISSDPCVPDPYEQERVCIKRSIIVGAEEGLFSKVDAGPGVLLSFYNGVRLNHEEVDERSWEENSYTMILDDEDVLDVPVKLSNTLQYCATLGHKINHSFRSNCFTERFNHPRFGKIIAIRTRQSVSRGSELTINYGYGVRIQSEAMDVPDWYRRQIELFTN